MIDFNYTAPELLPFRIQEVLDAPNEPHRIGDVVYVPKGGGACRYVWSFASNGWVDWTCDSCGNVVNLDVHVEFDYNYCPNCGRKVKR